MIIIKYAVCGDSLASQRESIRNLFNGLFLKYLNINGAYERIEKDKEGKPFINGIKNAFSISHTKGLCVVALCVESSNKNVYDNEIVIEGDFQQIGIDVQSLVSVDKAFAYKRIAEKYFSEEEAINLLSIDSNEVFIKEFIKIWTQKESFCKMKGKGLKILKQAKFDNSDSTYFRTFEIFLLQKQYFISFCGKNN